MRLTQASSLVLGDIRTAPPLEEEPGLATRALSLGVTHAVACGLPCQPSGRVTVHSAAPSLWFLLSHQRLLVCGEPWAWLRASNSHRGRV